MKGCDCDFADVLEGSANDVAMIHAHIAGSGVIFAVLKACDLMREAHSQFWLASQQYDCQFSSMKS